MSGGRRPGGREHQFRGDHKTGFEAFIANAARDHGVFYGLAAAMLALFTGWAQASSFVVTEPLGHRTVSPAWEGRGAGRAEGMSDDLQQSWTRMGGPLVPVCLRGGACGRLMTTGSLRWPLAVLAGPSWCWLAWWCAAGHGQPPPRTASCWRAVPPADGPDGRGADRVVAPGTGDPSRSQAVRTHLQRAVRQSSFRPAARRAADPVDPCT